MSAKNQPIAFVYAFFMSVFGATAAACLKFIAQDLNIALICFWQSFICLIVSVILLIQRSPSRTALSQKLKVDPADRLALIIRGLSGILGFLAFYYAIREIPLIDATLLRHSSPLFVPLLAWLLLRQKTNPLALIIIMVGFAGVFITLNSSLNPSQIVSAELTSKQTYALIGLSSAAFLALSMVSTYRLKSYPASVILFYYFLISSLVSLPLSFGHWQLPTLIESLGVLYLGVSIYFTMYLYNKAFTLTSAAHIAPMTYLSVVHAGIIGYFIWDHTPSTDSLIGMAIVISCGLIAGTIGLRRAQT